MGGENNIERIPQQIRKMHFLVHPGYLHDEKGYGHLLDKYEGKLARLQNDEIVIIFSHIPKRWMHPAKRAPHIDELMARIGAITKKLGDRAIVLSSDTPIFETNSAITTIRRIANARGFSFNEATLTEAYGEILSACVDAAAANLNRTGGFSRPTAIDVAATDYDETQKMGYAVKDLEAYKAGVKGNQSTETI